VIAENFRTAINEVMWDEATGSWYDYDYVRHQLRKDFYPSNLVPLWVNAHNGDSNVVAKVVQYFKDQGVDKYAGGVPTSLKHSGEQWDFPNGWAPLNHIVVEAFENSGSVEAKALAFSLAQKWIWNNYKAYEETQLMFEKVCQHGIFQI
jgi:alpha,alpha-trehalase